MSSNPRPKSVPRGKADIARAHMGKKSYSLSVSCKVSVRYDIKYQRDVEILKDFFLSKSTYCTQLNWEVALISIKKHTNPAFKNLRTIGNRNHRGKTELSGLAS